MKNPSVSSIDNITRDDKTFELGYKLIRLLYIIYQNCETIFTPFNI